MTPRTLIAMTVALAISRPPSAQAQVQVQIQAQQVPAPVLVTSPPPRGPRGLLQAFLGIGVHVHQAHATVVVASPVYYARPPVYVAAPLIVQSVVVSPPVVAAAPPIATPAVVQMAEKSAPFFTLAVTGQDHRPESGLGAALRLEATRWGLHLEALGTTTHLPGGLPAVEKRGLAAAHISYSVLSGARGRLRLEGGVSGLFDACGDLVGPDLGVSADATLLGPIGLSGGAYVRPFPGKQVDLRAGAFVALWAVRIDAGFRRLRLEDAPSSHKLDWVNGFGQPYVGASLVF